MTHSAGATADQSSTSTQEAQEDNSLSTGGKAGIGVGVGLVCLAAAVGAGTLIYRRRKKRNNEMTGTTAEQNGYVHPEMTSMPDEEGQPKPPAPVELDAGSTLIELDSTSREPAEIG